MTVQLRPRLVVQNGTTVESAPTLMIPIQRCPVALASAPPLIGASENRVVVRLGAACARNEGGLDFITSVGRAPVERVELINGERYVVVRIGRLETDSLGLSVRRRNTVLGTLQLNPGPLPALRARLEIEGQAIDIIPTNRWARIVLPAPPPLGR